MSTELSIEEITHCIEVGQPNLDYMKKVIYSTVNLILGMVPGFTQLSNAGAEFRFKSSSCLWIVHFPLHSKIVIGSAIGFGRLAIECDEITEGGSRRSAFSINYGSIIELSLNQIERVYDDLPTFVGGMINTFPALRELLKPHMKAAQRKF